MCGQRIVPHKNYGGINVGKQTQPTQEQKIRSQRIAGQMLQQTEFKKGGDRGNQFTGGKVTDDDHAKLSDLGITKNESSTYQKIASIPEDVFEAEMENEMLYYVLHPA